MALDFSQVGAEDPFTFTATTPSPRPPLRRPFVEQLDDDENYEIKFNPINNENYYKTPCAPGHIRVLPQFLKDNKEAQKVFLFRDMRFNEFLDYLNNTMTPFHTFAKTKFNFKTPKQDKSYLKDIWNKSLKFRYQMKRLLSMWLLKKTEKKTIHIQNYLTLAEPTLHNAISWPDVKNRCTYTIDGETMLRSMTMYLHNSNFGEPRPIWPKNPNTNERLTEGQLLHITYALYAWCGKNKTKVPPILARFHQHKFCLKTLMLRNRHELAYTAAKQVFKDLSSEDAVEQLLDCVENYACLPPEEREVYEKKFPVWAGNTSEKDLLKEWQALLPDVLQHEQFDVYVRHNWHRKIDIERTVRLLWRRTKSLVNKNST